MLTRGLYRSHDKVVCAAQIKTKEEEALFASIKGINPQLLERLSQRLFFVVNKADVKHVCEGVRQTSATTKRPHSSIARGVMPSTMLSNVHRWVCFSFRSGRDCHASIRGWIGALDAPQHCQQRSASASASCSWAPLQAGSCTSLIGLAVCGCVQVTAQMGIASFELRPEQVLLVSARDAYLARLILSKQPVPPRLLANFREIAFGRSRSRVCWITNRFA